MSGYLRKLSYFILLFNFSTTIFANPTLIGPLFHLTRTLQLAPGQSNACQIALGNTPLKVDIAYDFNPKTRMGLGFARLHNPTGGVPPITAQLDQLGESDHLAFSHYYEKPWKSFWANGKSIYIYSIMLDICDFKNKPKEGQVGIQAYLSSQSKVNTACLLTTKKWNFCR